MEEEKPELATNGNEQIPQGNRRLEAAGSWAISDVSIGWKPKRRWLMYRMLLGGSSGIEPSGRGSVLHLGSKIVWNDRVARLNH